MTATETKNEDPWRLRPSVALLILAGSALIGTLLLGWLGTLPGEADAEVRREVFGNIPSIIVVLFYATASLFLAVALYLFAERARSWERGAWERRSGHWKHRANKLVDALMMKTVMEDRTAGVMHSLIYWSFIVLFLGTVILEIDHLAPAAVKFLNGWFYQAYSAILDLAGLVFLGGLAWAAVRRYAQRPWRLRTKTRPEDAWILLILALIGITGLLTEAARLSMVGRPSFEVWSFVGYPLSNLIPAENAAGIHQALWISHVVVFFLFLVMLPLTKLRHMFTTPVNLALLPRDRPKGAMREMPNLLEATDIETVGASRVEDFTWKQLFDTDACTICGRCTDVCPANQTGKSLDPREIVLKLGQVAADTYGISPPVSVNAELTVSSDLVFERITAEELWACTTCRACDEACPAGLEIVDKILDMRRFLSLMEAEFPSELGKTYLNLENSSNVYGADQSTRGDWRDELDFEVKMLGEPGVTAEYLYWVGCAGSFDDRNRKATISTAKLLHEAGVDFAILGPRELCNGDPARRTGNEYVFQGLALQNIETLNDLGVHKVVTQCPHCFNTLGNEYPQFGGDYEVIHHSELLMSLISDGKIKPKSNGQSITFHDPCYLGRHNDVYAPPRDVVDAVGTRVEMPRTGSKSFCCGAGGGKMWYEETTGKRINIERTEEAVATGADVIAAGCPFCFVMLDDGIRELGVDEQVIVKDLATLLEEQVFGD
ncbi:MAG: heterodisulfide reductase-related iron-sulfur binding cluster [Acidimicrobiia bacterium]|nr:MAG: heterodisulfide reductase-related iron-sulfur binding cluster [Acidimicrobiia bacterium]